jgi:hypothetical protein
MSEDKIIIIADLDVGEGFDPAPQTTKQFLLDNMPSWVEAVLMRKHDSADYGLTNVTVYVGLEDFDADRAETIGAFTSGR